MDDSALRTPSCPRHAGPSTENPDYPDAHRSWKQELSDNVSAVLCHNGLVPYSLGGIESADLLSRRHRSHNLTRHISLDPPRCPLEPDSDPYTAALQAHRSHLQPNTPEIASPKNDRNDFAPGENSSPSQSSTSASDARVHPHPEIAEAGEYVM
jgi:hypothetical protein